MKFNIAGSLRLALLVVLSSALLSLNAQAQGQARSGGLIVEVKLQGKARMAGKTQFSVNLRNSGTSPIELAARPGWDQDGGLELKITQVNGASRSLPRDEEESTRAGNRRTGRMRMPLAPGHSIGVFREFPTSDEIKAPGQYRVVVLYRGLGTGEVSSAPLEFTVTE